MTLFLLLAFGLSWVLWLPLVFGEWNTLLLVAGAFGPFLAGVPGTNTGYRPIACAAVGTGPGVARRKNSGAVCRLQWYTCSQPSFPCHRTIGQVVFDKFLRGQQAVSQ